MVSTVELNYPGNSPKDNDTFTEDSSTEDYIDVEDSSTEDDINMEGSSA